MVGRTKIDIDAVMSPFPGRRSPRSCGMDRGQATQPRQSTSPPARLADVVSAELSRMISAGTLVSGARLPTGA
jgi:hypothetical protein